MCKGEQRYRLRFKFLAFPSSSFRSLFYLFLFFFFTASVEIFTIARNVAFMGNKIIFVRMKPSFDTEKHENALRHCLVFDSPSLNDAVILYLSFEISSDNIYAFNSILVEWFWQLIYMAVFYEYYIPVCLESSLLFQRLKISSKRFKI